MGVPAGRGRDLAAKPRRIFPVLLAGGAGARLWPLSQVRAPKQLLRLNGERTLLQEAALRARDPVLFEPLIAICGVEHRRLAAEQLRRVGAEVSALVLEPAPRDTAAAAAVAALLVREAAADALLLLMPTDHRIADVAGFLSAVKTGMEAARSGRLVLFGISPQGPATGFGYIRVGEPLDASGGVRRVAGFVEKPDEGAAARYLGSGGYLWNSGIFLMSARSLCAEFARLEPALLALAQSAVGLASRGRHVVRLDPESFGRCAALSLDRAIMERTDKAVVVAAGFDWTDLGSWSAVWANGRRDEAGNVVVGRVLTAATSDSYIHSEGPLIATIGVEGLIVIATRDAVLVARKDRDQDVGKIGDRLRDAPDTG